MHKLDRRIVARLVGEVIVILGATWVLATKWPSQTQATASIAVGLAIVIVTWEYTGHTANMVKAMQAEHKSADDRHRESLEEAQRRDRKARNAAAYAMAIELEALDGYLNSLKPPEQGGGTRPPYPQLELQTLTSYASHMVTMPNECNSAVIHVYYQLLAANARAESDGYWKRATPLQNDISMAITHLRAVFAGEANR